MCKRNNIFNLLLIFILFIIPNKIFAENSGINKISQNLYEEQFELSGVENLYNQIPENVLHNLENIGIKTGNYQELLNINYNSIFDIILNLTKKKITKPLKITVPIVCIILIYSIIKSFNLNLNNNIEKVMVLIGLLCTCLYIVNPVSKIINSVFIIIKIASNFIMCYVPIMSAIMISSGQVVTASSYQTLVLSAGQIINYICSNFMIPIMNILLGVLLTSCLTNTFDLTKISHYFYKITKIILEFISLIFTGILTLQNLVTNTADNLGTHTLKFALNNFVPIVGNMLNDTFGTVNSCLKLLKSSIGVFGILAGLLIFLPTIIECLLWIFSLNISACISDVFEVKKISCLLKSISKIMSILISILFFTIIILIISSVIVLIMGAK